MNSNRNPHNTDRMYRVALVYAQHVGLVNMEDISTAMRADLRRLSEEYGVAEEENA